MNTERIKQRLGVETSKNSVNTDAFIKINIDGKERLLPPDEINKIVNVGERFNKERQGSGFYRILGTINSTVANPLFNLNDSTLNDLYTWSGFNYNDPILGYTFLDKGPVDLNYKEGIEKYLKEREGWFGYFDPDLTKSGLCNFFDMEPKRERFSFTPDIVPYHSPNSNPVKNWELTITYPKNTDKTHPMINGGLLIVEAVPAIVSTRNMVAFGMPCLHNLSIGDTVRISGTSGYDGDHVVVRTGLDNGDLKNYYFVIDLPPTGVVSSNSRIKRLFGGQESEYYFRIFQKVKTRNMSIIETDDYETYTLAFSENVYSDAITQFVFNEDIDVSNLTDNLGRPISELYLTIIKTPSSGSANNELFTNVSSGIETPFIPKLITSNTNTFLRDIPAINRIHNGGTLPFPSHIPLENNVSINNNNNIANNNDFYGDVVEYNKNEVKETILGEVSHRFNTNNRETTSPLSYVSTNINPPTLVTTNLGPRQEGYFYKAHHQIKIREFSTYVEQGDSQTGGIPDYAINMGDGRFLWRDLLDIGFKEGDAELLDYPFLNGCHYMYNNYCFHLRRQDPFDNWGLYYSSFPADPIGESMTNKFTTNTEEDAC
jgi:hypothetical protein